MQFEFMEEPDAYQQEVRWRAEVRLFVGALWKHNVSFAMGAAFAIVGLVLNLTGNPPWLQGIWWVLSFLGLLRSFFCAWRDERRLGCLAKNELSEIKEWMRKSEEVTITRLTSSSQPKAATFLAAVDSEDFIKHFVPSTNSPAIGSETFREWMDAPKHGVYRMAHCRVEDLIFVCTQGNQFRGLLTANWYPDTKFAWIGFLFIKGGDWAKGKYAPELVKQLVLELRARGAELCFFDVEESQADAMLRLYARYIATSNGPRLYTLDTPYKRPPDCAGAPAGKRARLGIVDLRGNLSVVDNVSAETCHHWLRFVFEDAHGDAEAPDTEKWHQHQKSIQRALTPILLKIPEGSLVKLKQIPGMLRNLGAQKKELRGTKASGDKS